MRIIVNDDWIIQLSGANPEASHKEIMTAVRDLLMGQDPIRNEINTVLLGKSLVTLLLEQN